MQRNFVAWFISATVYLQYKSKVYTAVGCFGVYTFKMKGICSWETLRKNYRRVYLHLRCKVYTAHNLKQFGVFTFNKVYTADNKKIKLYKQW